MNSIEYLSYSVIKNESKLQNLIVKLNVQVKRKG